MDAMRNLPDYSDDDEDVSRAIQKLNLNGKELPAARDDSVAGEILSASEHLLKGPATPSTSFNTLSESRPLSDTSNDYALADTPTSTASAEAAEPTLHNLLAWSDRTKTWKPYVSRKNADAAVQAVRDVRVITYNVWFNAESDRSLRHRALFKLCLTSKREVDVICLQEMTAEACEELMDMNAFDKDHPLRPMAERSTKILKAEWLITEFLPQSMLFKQKTWFGGVLLVRRKFAASIANALRVFSLPLPSACGRRLHYVEFMHDERVVLRAASFHLDGAPIAVELRKRQLLYMAERLCSDNVPALMCGDSNIVTFDELKQVVAPPFGLIDAMAGIDTGPTYNTTYVIKEGNTFRIDLVLLSPHFTPTAGELLGAKPFPIPAGAARPRRLGKGGQVYPSDHLGVFVQASLRNAALIRTTPSASPSS